MTEGNPTKEESLEEHKTRQKKNGDDLRDKKEG